MRTSMNQQARRTNRKLGSSPKQKLIGHGLNELVLIFFSFIGLYLFISLVTYYPADPGISHGGQVEEIRNKGGLAGALFADLFFLWFGYFAYLFPIMVGYVGWLIYQGKHRDILAQPKDLIIPGVGFVLTLIAGCGLAIVHFSAESILLPSHAGGLLGTWVGHLLVDIVDPLGATLIFLAMFFTGVTLLTGLSWLKLMDTLGYHTLQWLPVLNKYASRRFFPWLFKHLKQTLLLLLNLLRNLLKQFQQGTQHTYQRWQKRRADWRKERERLADEYEEAYDDYYEDDDYFIKEKARRNSVSVKPKDHYSPPITDPVYPNYLEIPAEPTISPIEEPKQPMPTWTLPDIALLNPLPKKNPLPTPEKLGQWLQDGLKTLSIECTIQHIHSGPVLTHFEVQMHTSINTQHLDELNQALAKTLQINYVRTLETQPNFFNLEIEHPERQPIHLKELLTTQEYQQSTSPLTVGLGQDTKGHPLILDLARLPHLLIAGNVGTEKTMMIDTLLLSLLFKAKPEQLRLLLIDNAQQELSVYAELPHLISPIIADPQHIPAALKWCVQEMEKRYRLMASLNTRNINDYNQAIPQLPPEELTTHLPLPALLIILHELAELTKHPEIEDIENDITQLTQKARSAGIQLIIATQHPTVNVITGLIKANISTRIAFQVTNKSESRTILGQMGAETLLGQGDMLFLTASVAIRAHASTITTREVQRIVHHLKNQGPPNYLYTPK